MKKCQGCKLKIPLYRFKEGYSRCISCTEKREKTLLHEKLIIKDYDEKKYVPINALDEYIRVYTLFMK